MLGANCAPVWVESPGWCGGLTLSQSPLAGVAISDTVGWFDTFPWHWVCWRMDEEQTMMWPYCKCTTLFLKTAKILKHKIVNECNHLQQNSQYPLTPRMSTMSANEIVPHTMTKFSFGFTYWSRVWCLTCQSKGRCSGWVPGDGQTLLYRNSAGFRSGWTRYLSQGLLLCPHLLEIKLIILKNSFCRLTLIMCNFHVTFKIKWSEHTTTPSLTCSSSHQFAWCLLCPQSAAALLGCQCVTVGPVEVPSLGCRSCGCFY